MEFLRKLLRKKEKEKRKRSQRTHSICILTNVHLFRKWLNVTAEYPKLEKIHKDHRVQLLASHCTTQHSNPMSESVV